jgi:hypothetical protein
METQPSTPLYKWKDITNEFKLACDGLDLGELLKDQHFGLFEAMSAVELMDPKMDAGMVANQSEVKIKSFNQALNVNNNNKLKLSDKNNNNFINLG